MLMSMTGYGSGSLEAEGIRVRIDLRCLNSRYQDFQLQLPHSLLAIEVELRKRLSQEIHRGKLGLALDLQILGSPNSRYEFNEALAMRQIEALEAFAEKLGRRRLIEISEIIHLPGVFSETMPAELDQERLLPLVFDCLDIAVENLQLMRAREGEKLSQDISLRLEHVLDLRQQMTESLAFANDALFAKLDGRISAAFEKYSVELDAERLYQEVALLVDKRDISEELTRIKSHVEAMTQICDSDEAEGKRLDFLCQELMREANTICSKSGDLAILNNALELKTEIEKIREQVQNIE
ncbi:MAG: YicC/YloC family endoribonuclease [Eubacteriales bacterium]|nr:YicC/YloC family endoribonuclease [Eubacteriales bacterium]